MHGMSWSYLTSTYQVTLDNVTLSTFSANATTGVPGFMYPGGVFLSHANLSKSSHVLTVDNKQGAGLLGFDYVEVISVSGGSL